MNWAPYAAYNPQLTHLPETWPLVSLSPTVEPFVVFRLRNLLSGGLLPGDLDPPASPASRQSIRLSGDTPSSAWHCSILVIGFVYDAILETILVRTQLYIYSQVIPFGSLFTGKPYQFPLLWESTFVCWVMIPAGVLLYRDDTGRTVAEKLAQDRLLVRPFRARPALASFVVMFAILNVAYLSSRRQLRRDQGDWCRDFGGLSLALPRGQGLRPTGLLRRGRTTRTVHGRYLGRLGDGSVRPTRYTRPTRRGRCSPYVAGLTASQGLSCRVGRTTNSLMAEPVRPTEHETMASATSDGRPGATVTGKPRYIGRWHVAVEVIPSR